MDAIERLNLIINQHPVVLFLKGDSQCPKNLGSLQTLQCLEPHLSQIELVDITRDTEIRAFLPKFSDEQDVPQLYLNGELIGDTKVILELASSGVLSKMIQMASSTSARLAS